MTICRARPRAYVLSILGTLLVLWIMWLGIDVGEPAVAVLSGLFLPVPLFWVWGSDRARIDLDGSRVHVRAGRRWLPTVDLDRLTEVRVERVRADSPQPRFLQARVLHLADDRARVALSATVTRTEPLHREIQARIETGTVRVDLDDPTRRLLERSVR